MRNFMFSKYLVSSDQNTFTCNTGICHRSSNYLEMFYMYGKSLTSWKVDCYVIYRTLS